MTPGWNWAGAACSTRACWRWPGSTRSATPPLPSAASATASSWHAMASRTSGCSGRTTCACCGSSEEPSMRVPISWLREFVPVPEDPAALIDRLAMLGFGHEPVEWVGEEAVLDLEVASNRPDLLSVLGVAREVAAAWEREVTPPAFMLRRSTSRAGAAADVAVDDPEGCPRYTAHVITGVRVGTSPDWMVGRLEASGIRSINNVVDVTNYVMLEQGQPLHAFDLDRLAGARIIVRRARPGERVVTLDGVDRALDPEMLAIADAERAVAVAGVMGGADTEIGASTSRVLLEAAAFHGSPVRRPGGRPDRRGHRRVGSGRRHRCLPAPGAADDDHAAPAADRARARAGGAGRRGGGHPPPAGLPGDAAGATPHGDGARRARGPGARGGLDRGGGTPLRVRPYPGGDAGRGATGRPRGSGARSRSLRA